MILSVKYAGVVLCVCVCPCAHTHTHTHTHTIVDVATSVGPIRGAAIARLVDLALLLQAARLATLARTTLNVESENTLMARRLQLLIL